MNMSSAATFTPVNPFQPIEDKFAQLREARKAYLSQCEDTLKEAFRLFFQQATSIKKVFWTQYTPYWNDGEPCEFSVNEPTFSEEEYYDGDLPDEGDGLTKWNFNSRNKNRSDHPDGDLIIKMTNLMESREGQIALEELFGDHVFVQITADNVYVDEYDHE